MNLRAGGAGKIHNGSRWRGRSGAVGQRRSAAVSIAELAVVSVRTGHAGFRKCTGGGRAAALRGDNATVNRARDTRTRAIAARRQSGGTRGGSKVAPYAHRSSGGQIPRGIDRRNRCAKRTIRDIVEKRIG